MWQAIVGLSPRYIETCIRVAFRLRRIAVHASSRNLAPALCSRRPCYDRVAALAGSLDLSGSSSLFIAAGCCNGPLSRGRLQIRFPNLFHIFTEYFAVSKFEIKWM